MPKATTPFFIAALLGMTAASGLPAVAAQPDAAPQEAPGGFDIVKAPVLKVFSAEDGDHRFVAYAVTWKGKEVIVTDVSGRSRFKAGDTISFMSQKMRTRGAAEAGGLLAFILADPAVLADGPGKLPPAEQARIMKLAQGDLTAANTESERFYALVEASKKAFQGGEIEKARTLATELAALAPKHREDWNHGNAVQAANQVLGQIALSKGDLVEAKKRLLASADSDGSPQMNSFGPNMRLAKALLEKGEKDVVLEYFERCAKFWKTGAAQLATWKTAVEKGQIPDFGANLDY
ncbi:MAG: hypothetical protein KGQ61_12810 [Planctomycetes bacterium]|nr:hypothetical protein [Planctomycetota bacterium]